MFIHSCIHDENVEIKGMQVKFLLKLVI